MNINNAESKSRRRSGSVVMLALALAAAAAVRLASGSFFIGTDQLRFEVSNTSQAHWGCLNALTIAGDPRPTNNGILRADAAGYTQLWRLTATACNASFPVSTLMMDSCTAACSRKFLVEQTAETAHMRWEGCAPCPAGPGSPGCGYSLLNSSGLPATLDIDVMVTVVGGRSTWNASVGKQHAGGVCLQSLALPSLESLRFTAAGAGGASGGNEELFVPYMFGATGSDPSFPWGGTMPEVFGVRGIGDQTGDDRERAWVPNGWDRTMSFAAWLSDDTTRSRHSGSDGVGLYMGVHDPQSRLKMIPVGPGPHGLGGNLRAVHVPDSFADDSTATFVLPYEVVLQSFRGGWWEAAQLYREWALANAVWTRKGNLSARAAADDMPAWLLRSPLWLRLSGNDPEQNSTFELVDGIRELLASGGGDEAGDPAAITDLGLHWYSWNDEEFDTHYPIYTARAGFGEAVARLQMPHAGITARVVPYTNGRIWDSAGPLHSVPATATCKAWNGTPYSETYGSGVKFTVMDPSSAFMREEWSSAVANISQHYNTSGVYSDQVSCSHSEACYDQEHGTNASSWGAGAQQLLSEMTRKMGPEKVLISESQDQTMMGDLHAFLGIYGWLGQMRCQTVLSWQAVYGGWAVNVGDIRYPAKPTAKTAAGKSVLNATEAAAHRAISAQLFVSGGVLGWFGGSIGWENLLGLPIADVNYTRLLASTKVVASKFLVHGRLWRQPVWRTAAVPTMQLHDYGYMEHDYNQSCATAIVLAECWLADDGTFAVVATNHGDSEIVLNVTVDVSAVGAPAAALVHVVEAMAPLSAKVLPLSARTVAQ